MRSSAGFVACALLLAGCATPDLLLVRPPCSNDSRWVDEQVRACTRHPAAFGEMLAAGRAILVDVAGGAAVGAVSGDAASGALRSAADSAASALTTWMLGERSTGPASAQQVARCLRNRGLGVESGRD